MRANAAERRGTHKTKNRANVSGSGKKPWRQKGTGRARVGEIRNPLWRKGGTVFGPQPRSYDYQLPKKVERGALRAALAQKLRDGQVVVVDIARRRRVQDEGGGGACWRGSASTGKAVLIDVASTTTSRGRCGTCRASALVRERPRDARDVVNAERVVATKPRDREAAGGTGA